mmetsp:Transcript_3890/g.11162  ORF Transcript_3890/g.11162 Transcript_3890/m.11162 type:complete len:310 (-) Transcript_3890:97-1026(-)
MPGPLDGLAQADDEVNLEESELFGSLEHSADNWTGSISMLTESLRPSVGRPSVSTPFRSDHALLRKVPDAPGLALDLDVRVDSEMKSELRETDPDPKGNLVSMAALTDKILSGRLCSYQGKLTSLNLTNAVALQGLFFDSLPTTIKHLDLTGCRSIKSEFFTSYVSKFFSLESLFLVGCEGLDDEALERVVTFCPRLEGIAVPPSTTDRGLAALARSISLKRVGIRACSDVTLQGIRFLLRSKPDLERVVVNNCPRVSSEKAKESVQVDGESPGLPKDMPQVDGEPYDKTPAQRRRSLNLEIMKEFVSS